MVVGFTGVVTAVVGAIVATIVEEVVGTGADETGRGGDVAIVEEVPAGAEVGAAEEVGAAADDEADWVPHLPNSGLHPVPQ